jgi:hypothetical protein
LGCLVVCVLFLLYVVLFDGLSTFHAQSIAHSHPLDLGQWHAWTCVSQWYWLLGGIGLC